MLRTLPHLDKVLEESLLSSAAQAQFFRVADPSACAIQKLDWSRGQGCVLDTFFAFLGH